MSGLWLDRRRFIGYASGGLLLLAGCESGSRADTPHLEVEQLTKNRWLSYRDSQSTFLVSPDYSCGVCYFSDGPIGPNVPKATAKASKIVGTIGNIMLRVYTERNATGDLKVISELWDNIENVNPKVKLEKNLKVQPGPGGIDGAISWINWEINELKWNGYIYNLNTGNVRGPIRATQIPTPAK
jgi:hypothetical protein